MPKSLDPSSRLTLVLACDAEKPEATQPRIFAKTLTLNQQRKMMTAMEGLQSGSAGEKIDAALDAAMLCLTGWENMKDMESGELIPFSREAIADVLSLEEIVESINYVMGAASASPTDKKKSELPPSSDAGNSANPALESVEKL